MTTKKITPKKRTPDPIVVLEEDDLFRLVYDARTDKLIAQHPDWDEHWYECLLGRDCPCVDEVDV